MNVLKNITNGQINLNYNESAYKVENKNIKLTRSPDYDSLQFLKHQNPNAHISYYIENIRSGSFSQTSEAHMLESSQEKQELDHFTVDSFETEMAVLLLEFQNKLFKITTFFQGLLTGMALLYTITLNLSDSVSADLVRVQDQSIRILSLLSALGSLYSVIISKTKYQSGKKRGSSSQVDLLYKSFILCLLEVIFYLLGYIIFNISHPFAVQYNINGSEYSSLRTLTTVYTVVLILGWIITNTNTYKYQNRN